MRKQSSLLMVGVLTLLAAVSCVSGGGATGGARESAGATGSKGAGDLAGDIQVNIEGGGAEEDLTPILMRVLDAPEPVKGSDGKFHLVYELELTNTSPGTAKVKSVKTIDPGSGKVVGTLAGAGVAARMTLLGDLSLEETTKIGTGQTALVFLDATFEDPGDVPEAMEHRLKVSFKIPATFASNVFPTKTTETGARTEVSREKPVVLGPPLKGKNWVAFNGCCTLSSHRGAMIALDQKLLATERYAIDWIKSDDQGRVTAGVPGDPKQPKSYPSYGKPVLSVADGEVVKVVDKYPDATPTEPDPSLKLKDLGGNYVIVDIGDGRYAFYAHLKPDSIKVEEGDRVTRGQELARLGNSGNTTSPHLHFHVMDAPMPLGADRNLPYVFDAFDYQGAVKEDASPDNITLDLLKTPEPRKDELPLANSAVTFAAPEED